MSCVVSVGYSEYKRTLDQRLETAKVQEYLRRPPEFDSAVKELFRRDTPPTALSSNLANIIDASEHIKQLDIFKQPRDLIRLEPGGVVGDSHFHPHEYSNEDGEDYVIKWVAEVNLFRSEELSRLNEVFGTDIGPGGVGENILTNGIDLDTLPVNTILKIGETAQVHILGRRTFCFKLVNVFLPDQKFWPKSDRDRFDRSKIGIVGQVIQSGTIYPGDQIEIVLPLGNSGPMPLESNKPAKFTKTKIVDIQQLFC